MYQPLPNDALVERARSIIATRFLGSSADVLLTVDDDIIFTPGEALQLCEQAVTHDLVVGIYVTRSRGRCKPTSFFLPDHPVEFGDDPTPVPIRWGASGFMAIHRRVFERLAPDLPLCHEGTPLAHHPFYLPFVVNDDLGKPIMLSEDWALTQRAREAGFGVYCNPALRIRHLGLYDYGLEDMNAESYALPLAAVSP
jgi:hypothetical protein